jgi:hypothetical protein
MAKRRLLIMFVLTALAIAGTVYIEGCGSSNNNATIYGGVQ